MSPLPTALPPVIASYQVIGPSAEEPLNVAVSPAQTVSPLAVGAPGVNLFSPCVE